MPNAGGQDDGAHNLTPYPLEHTPLESADRTAFGAEDMELEDDLINFEPTFTPLTRQSATNDAPPVTSSAETTMVPTDRRSPVDAGSARSLGNVPPRIAPPEARASEDRYSLRHVKKIDYKKQLGKTDVKYTKNKKKK